MERVEVQLEEVHSHRCGERQRVAIARAFASDAALILADCIYRMEDGKLTAI